MVNNLEKELKVKINSPSDEFIYYLGYNVYEKCENTNNEQIKANCKDLYYNFLKNEGK